MSKVMFTFKPGHPTVIKAEGIPGGDCQQATEPYLKGMPGRTLSDVATDEMHLPPVTQTVDQQISH